MRSVINLLNRKLREEREYLAFFENRMSDPDPQMRRMAEGNIPSAKVRIEELVKAIEMLNVNTNTNNNHRNHNQVAQEGS